MCTPTTRLGRSPFHPSEHMDGAQPIRGFLLGGAVGDAMGAVVEFLSWGEIRSRFPPSNGTL